MIFKKSSLNQEAEAHVIKELIQGHTNLSGKAGLELQQVDLCSTTMIHSRYKKQMITYTF